MAILGFLGSIFGGGVTGLFGIALQRFFDLRNKKLDIEINKQKYDQELALKRADAEIMREEWAQRTKVAEIEATAKVDAADAEAFSKSFNEPQSYSAAVQNKTTGQGWILVILDLIRGLIRPLLTVYLCVITTMIYLYSKSLIENGSLNSHQAVDIVKLIISTILYLTTTCILWWFGTRNKQAAPKGP